MNIWREEGRERGGGERELMGFIDSLSLSLSFSLSPRSHFLSLTHTHTHSLSPSHAHTHTHTHIQGIASAGYEVVLSCKAGSHEQATQALRVLRQVGLVGSKGVVKEVIFMINMILFMEKLMLNMILLCAIFMLNIIFII